MTREIPYDPVLSKDRFEIRRYPPIVLATVADATDNGAFSILFDYIQGSNRSRKKVPMTAPVISSERIEMTSPVISREGSFSFVMPPDMEQKDVPAPVDDRIRIETVPKRTLAVIRFGGRTTRGSVERRSEELLGLCRENDLKVIGTPFLMRYNSPFVPGFLRRNELAVRIED